MSDYTCVAALPGYVLSFLDCALPVGQAAWIACSSKCFKPLGRFCFVAYLCFLACFLVISPPFLSQESFSAGDLLKDSDGNDCDCW